MSNDSRALGVRDRTEDRDDGQVPSGGVLPDPVAVELSGDGDCPGALEQAAEHLAQDVVGLFLPGAGPDTP